MSRSIYTHREGVPFYFEHGNGPTAKKPRSKILDFSKNCDFLMKIFQIFKKIEKFFWKIIVTYTLWISKTPPLIFRKKNDIKDKKWKITDKIKDKNCTKTTVTDTFYFDSCGLHTAPHGRAVPVKNWKNNRACAMVRWWFKNLDKQQSLKTPIYGKVFFIMLAFWPNFELVGGTRKL